MKTLSTISIAGTTHATVRNHLFPSDGNEAAAILLCSRTPAPRLRLLVQRIILIPYNECSVRSVDEISWPGKWVEKAIDEAEEENLSLILIHSHPNGTLEFSSKDDASDRVIIQSISQAFGDSHGSAIMTPDGKMRARLYNCDGEIVPCDLVSVVGDEIIFWWDSEANLGDLPARPMAFTADMEYELGKLSAGLIGVSGTGSLVGESLVRLGFGELTPVDFDRIEKKNLNRIINATLADIGRLKVSVFADHVRKIRESQCVYPISESVASRKAVLALSQCDVIFCCVDTLEARYIADLISASFLIPVIDVGVVIPTRKTDGGYAIADVVGRVDFIQPGGASLADRLVYTAEGLRAEYLHRVAPTSHSQEVEAGYVKGMVEEAPSVIALNMRAAATATTEFISRAYPFRHEKNNLYARTQFSLSAAEEEYTGEVEFQKSDQKIMARGNREPLLNLPFLSI